MPVRPILPRTITRVTGLSERPVFFVTLNNEPQAALVVKGENKVGDEVDVKASVRWASKMMKNVNNPLVNSKPLMPEEWEVFRKFATSLLAPTRPSRGICETPVTSGSRCHLSWVSPTPTS